MRTLLALAITVYGLIDAATAFELAAKGLDYTRQINSAILTVSIAEIIILSQYLKPFKFKKRYRKPFMAWPLV